MLTRTYSKTFQGVNKEDVWAVLTDVNNWPQWHSDLDDCKMEGPFTVGNHFMLKPKGMKAVKIVLTEVLESRSFTDCTTFFGAKMYNTHSLCETLEGLKITNLVVVTGPLRWLWVKLVARYVADAIPEETDSLIALARRSRE